MAVRLRASFTPMIAAAVIAAPPSGIVLGAGWITVLAGCGVAILLASKGRKKDLASIR
ncbi:hypothetical protein [Sinomonas mesophila]|uniref:hypothetical protein n=1 Tax=Sinomonas mesophila TaxID=1531955 RepID=UPI001C37D365|nr:hypothetical protein [Sinomonas mesophila]